MNPFKDLKTDQELGFSTVYDISNGNFSSLDGNMNALNDYKNSLVSINSNMLSNETNKINKRYFVKTNQTCKGTDLYTVIDDMTYTTSTDGTEKLNYGLLGSAYNNLQSINTDDILNTTSIGNNCVEITMITDENGTTEQRTVSMDDYQKLDCRAFPKKCKTYTGKKGDCDACNVEKKEPFAPREETRENKGLEKLLVVNGKLTILSIAYLSAVFLSFFVFIKNKK